MFVLEGSQINQINKLESDNLSLQGEIQEYCEIIKRIAAESEGRKYTAPEGKEVQEPTELTVQEPVLQTATEPPTQPPTEKPTQEPENSEPDEED